MDKWDDLVGRIQNGVLAEEPEAALTGALQLFAEFGRTLERVATALEAKLDDTDYVEAVPEVLDL